MHNFIWAFIDHLKRLSSKDGFGLTTQETVITEFDLKWLAGALPAFSYNDDRDKLDPFNSLIT